MRQSQGARRWGGTMVETAIADSAVMLMTLGLIVGGLGVFRYQEVAFAAREASRYASVHGSKYQQVTGRAAATAGDVYNNAILPSAAVLSANKLSYSVNWSPDNKPGSTVTVTVTYTWLPEAYLGGVTLSSTSSATISY